MNDRSDDATMHLIANITHQAINPIGGVIGTLDNIIDGTITENRRDQRLRSARAQLEYTVSLIRNLAFFAEYGGDALPARSGAFKTTVLPQNLIEAAMFFQEQAQNRGVRFEVIDKNHQTSVKGDPDLMRQVFMNIFDNYVKYAQAATTVQISHWVQKKTGNALIKFEGVSTCFDEDEDIFALGSRGRHAESITSSGSGLGLHICKLIIERAFNGCIAASYVHGRRTAVFNIRIPNGFIS